MDWEPNPFRPTRWEHDNSGRPLIWLTPTAQSLAGDKSAFVHGSRGSGKTTLLKSICWEDLARNPSLRLQRRISDFPHIGVYVRLPDHVSGSMGGTDWQKVFPTSDDPELELFRFFSLAVELVCADKALCAVHELRLNQDLDFEAVDEVFVVEEFVAEFPELAATVQGVRTFSDLARLCRITVRRMNEASGRGQVPQLIDRLPTREPNELLSTLCGKLSGVVRFRTPTSRPAPGFKFCLDDCEVLSPTQLRSINTMVRKSHFPVSWVICAVGETIESGDTFIEQQPLTDADRRVISLDERDRPEFVSLCEAVASLRTYFSLPQTDRPPVIGDNIARQFSLREKLGVVGVNEILGTILSRSTSPLAKQVVVAATRLSELANASPGLFPNSILGETPPYYQAYLLWHWTGREDAFASTAAPHEMARIEQHLPQLASPAFQAWLRRKMVGAMLQIAARLGFRQLPLSGSSVIISLADGSIRDFLEIMAAVYDAYKAANSKVDPGQVLRRFATSRTKVSARVQTIGIYRASAQYFDGVGALSDASSTSMARLIEGLGKYTNRLQSSPDDPSVLATSERGVFVLDDSYYLWPDENNEAQNVHQIVARAELSGYLRTVSVKRYSLGGVSSPRSSSTLTGVRLHRRFAPYFMFSYRGAYEPVRVSTHYLANLCAIEPEIMPDAWVASVAPLEIDISEQLSLPLTRFDDEA
ncbi:ORC-CDC6 family AAA ATPase [Aurantimonas coralicida]|uniref:ORC-CDC6 family AAA ATPase n=1 Tax=Aurantimonas coralicida TaxID=182270 RepID=UPI001D182C20|nr:hypothetical protein [Aurantimonas coralicida]MCC4296627.1 hypothetical protein [Aurantimonas coralicida]